MIAAIEVPNDQTVLHAATLAAASHMHLIKRKGETRISQIVPAGWYRISVSIKKEPSCTQ